MCVLVGADFTPPGTLSDEYAFPFLGVQGTSAPGVQGLVLAFGVADRAAGGLLPQSRELLGLVPLLPPPDRALPPAFEATPVFVPLPLGLFGAGSEHFLCVLQLDDGRVQAFSALTPVVGGHRCFFLHRRTLVSDTP